MAITRSAPSSRALFIANCPTGPAPHTAITSPGLMSHISAPMYPVGKMSDRNSTCSSVSPSGTLIGPTSANGTRAYSAWPPANPPVRWEYPKMPAVAWPNIFCAIHAFGLVFSQTENNPCRQEKQVPQAIGNGTTTRSPTFKLPLSPRPVSTTSPINSWPRMSPFSMVGTKPLNKCRSEPQMAVDVILTMASRELRIFGSGTSSTFTFRLPSQQVALIGRCSYTQLEYASIQR